MEFVGEFAELQQRIAVCPELATWRAAVVEHLAPRRGERILEIGCGAGLLLREIGLATGPHGLAAGVDISPDQIARAVRECEEVPAVRPVVGDARALAYPDGVFDAAVSIQVLEYIADAPTALAELGRALKPGGRLITLATNWTSAFWHGPEPELTAALSRSWEGHAAHPNLPARIGPMLQRAGFAGIRQMPVPVVNAAFDDRGYAFWLARLMAAQALQEAVPEASVRAWLDALEAAERDGEFFFSLVPILTTARST
ncbi:MAG: methyltransferase domain-containing protein [Pseudomonadota bacterium]